MEKTKKFTDLIVWQKAHQLVLRVYQITKTFSGEEIYGLTSQLRRAAVSVPNNIAEAYKKRSVKYKLYFLNISETSLEKTKYLLILSNDLKYAQTSELFNDAEEIGRLLNAYSKGIERNR